MAFFRPQRGRLTTPKHYSTFAGAKVNVQTEPNQLSDPNLCFANPERFPGPNHALQQERLFFRTPFGIANAIPGSIEDDTGMQEASIVEIEQDFLGAKPSDGSNYHRISSTMRSVSV
jgi:hypothetical protein